MRIINFSEVRNKLKFVLDQVTENLDYTIISRRDAEDAVVMSLNTFNSLIETHYLLKTPANARHLEKSIQQYHTNNVKEHELIAD